MQQALVFAAAIVCAAAVAQSIAKANGEMALLIGIGCACCGVWLLLKGLGAVLALFSDMVVLPYTETVLKAVTLSVVCKPLSEQCRANGQAGAAAAIEYAAAGAVLTLCIPIMNEVKQLAVSLLG